MPPSATTVTEVQENAEENLDQLVNSKSTPRKYRLIYANILTLGYAHLAALYGLYLGFTVATWNTIILTYLLGIVGGFGITAGAHRLWSHKSYKAKMPLQILLIIFNTLAFQNTAVDWILKHRMHHKYSDTDADPHNPTRGFFFSHIGWILVKKHEEVKKREKFIDMSDVYANPVLMFQKKYAIPLVATTCYILPTVVPMYFFGETLSTAWHLNTFRHLLCLHAALFVNSIAHLWGNKPYDKSINPTQSLTTSLLALGEGFHNYHHVFPWDYKSAELGNNYLNMTTLFINFFAWLGWAYDLKSASSAMIETRSKRTGDGSNAWGFK